MENINLDRFYINEYFNKLKILFRKLGYENKVININIAVNLYKTYGEGFSELYIKYGTGLTEKTFAIKVLDLKYGNYRKLKEVKGPVVIILKNVGDIQNIKNKMLEDGYENYILKNYSDFLQLYDKYGLTFTQMF